MNNLYIFILIPSYDSTVDFHLCQLKLHCRLCGSLLVHKKGTKQLKAGHPRFYSCSAFASELHSCFGLDAANDEAQIHPHSFCKKQEKCVDQSQLNDACKCLLHL